MQLNLFKLYISLLILAIIFNVVASAKLKNRISEYSPTKTPDDIYEMFQAIKKYNPEDSEAYNACMKIIAKNKYEDLLKIFWKNVNNVACTTQLFKREYFIGVISSTIEKIKDENVEKDCRVIVEKNFLDLSEIEGTVIQKKLRDIYGLYFNCEETPVKKSVITAFLGPHRGNAPSDLFKNMNSNN
jgi:hypothetical protein